MSIDLGRNINYDSSIEDSIWAPLRKHTLFQGMNGSQRMMIALAIGLNKGVRTKLKGKAPKVNLRGNNEIADRFQAYIIAVAVQEKGLDFLDRSNSEIREISEEYINTGLREMEKIFLKNEDLTLQINKLNLILVKKFKK
tara:strand:+ start:2001 stop:2420 length:420 start_codon:yes stop_codon:yes gene_type:complete